MIIRLHRELRESYQTSIVSNELHDQLMFRVECYRRSLAVSLPKRRKNTKILIAMRIVGARSVTKESSTCIGGNQIHFICLVLTFPVGPASSLSKAQIAGSVSVRGKLSHCPIALGSMKVNSGTILSRPIYDQPCRKRLAY